jgi:hypothetical protein
MNSSAAAQPDRFKPSPVGPHPIPSKEVLEEVLRQTLADVDVGDQTNASELSSLIDVARRHQGETRPTTTILCQLVGVLLESRFPVLQGVPEFRDTVTREIASTLVDDPYQRDLVQRLWSKLCDKAA